MRIGIPESAQIKILLEERECPPKSVFEGATRRNNDLSSDLGHFESLGWEGGDRRGWDGMLQTKTSRSVAKESKGVGVTETVIEGGRRLGLTEKHGAKIS